MQQPQAAGAAAAGRELGPPPSDGISSLRFAPDTDLLVATSWDCSVRLYDAGLCVLRSIYKHRGPVLDACFVESSHVISGGLDRAVKVYDIISGTEDILGRHDEAIKCVEHVPATGEVVTGSWDRTLKRWDPRSPADRALIGTVALPDRVYTISRSAERLVVGTAGRHVLIYDLRNMSVPEQQRESSLKYQTRSIRCYPDNTGYALASVEGRVAMEYFDLGEAVQAKKYAFKCHRQTKAGRDTVFPVNAIAFHPCGTFATGGCDGFINVWDGANKKRLYQYSRYPTSIAALAFNSNGTLLAVASSYTYEQGERDHPLDAIFVRNVSPVEVTPKPRAAVA
eukprot:jgi/Chlat1/1259/Chrsp115S00762